MDYLVVSDGQKMQTNVNFDLFSFILALFIVLKTPHMVLNMGYFILLKYAQNKPRLTPEENLLMLFSLLWVKIIIKL